MAIPYLIEDLEIEGGRIAVRPHAGFLKEYTCEEDFYVEYLAEDAFVDLGAEVLGIPFVLNALPVVWRSGARYRIRSLDSDLAASLAPMRESFRRLYPKLAWDGELIPDRIVEDSFRPFAVPRKPAMLFSGGVDSVYTSLTHLDTPQLLITILSLTGKHTWKEDRTRHATVEHFRAFASRFGQDCAFVTSNLGSYFPPAKLAKVWPRPRRWLVEVQHGLGFVGIVAPLVACKGLRQVLVASCEADHFGLPSASHPDILASVRWLGASIVLDGARITRQQKVRTIHSLISEHPKDSLALKPCLRPAPGFSNCGTCSKCLQTFLALVAEGAEPSRYGFPMPIERVVNTLQAHLLQDRILISNTAELSEWRDIQDALRRRLRYDKSSGVADSPHTDCLRWFVDYHLDLHYRRHSSPLRKAARRTRERMGLWLDAHPKCGRSVRAVQKIVGGSPIE